MEVFCGEDLWAVGAAREKGFERAGEEACAVWVWVLDAREVCGRGRESTGGDCALAEFVEEDERASCAVPESEGDLVEVDHEGTLDLWKE